MRTVNFKIPAGEEILACSIDFDDKESIPSIICLHGGASTRHSTKYLAETLQKNGKSVIRFDFSGHGDSTGKLSKSSLKKRFLETQAILEYFYLTKKVTVIGTSMGGYIACALTKIVQLENLILFGPAAYTTHAWDVEFGSGFTDIIRKERSYLNSDIPLLLKNYNGNTLFVLGSQDEIIPQEVIASYRNCLAPKQNYEEFIISGCPHPIHRWVAHYPSVRKQIEEKVVRTICS